MVKTAACGHGCFRAIPGSEELQKSQPFIEQNLRERFRETFKGFVPMRSLKSPETHF
jgi:hypothetical protein